jgi:hypothetical protein
LQPSLCRLLIDAPLSHGASSASEAFHTYSSYAPLAHNPLFPGQAALRQCCSRFYAPAALSLPLRTVQPQAAESGAGANAPKVEQANTPQHSPPADPRTRLPAIGLINISCIY